MGLGRVRAGLKKAPICLDADKDTCAQNDPNCLWRTHTCHFCGEKYKISRRALTGKYMIADHRKICKGLK